MSQADVRALIEQRLKDFADENDLQVAWQDVPFDPPAADYLASNLLPAETRSEDLAGAHRCWSGVFQITIATPSNKGPGAGEAWLKQLDALFPCNLVIAGPVLSVQIITPVSAGPEIPDESHVRLPASFQYRADFVG
jgi:hypothetical protein